MRYLRRAILAVLLLATLVLAACGSSVTNGGNPIKASGVLRVGTEGVYSPFSYHDPATGQLVGYDVDVARAVADKLGVKVEFVETPWDSIFAALEANRFDVVANEVTINAERKEKYDLSEPYSVGEGRHQGRRQLRQVARRHQGQSRRRDGHQQLGAGRPRSRCARRGRRGLHPGHQAAQPGPGRSGDQRQHRGVRLPCRDRRHLGEDRDNDRREERAGLRRPEEQRAAA